MGPSKGCVKTYEDHAVFWMMMMTEDGFSSFDTPVVDIAPAAARPDPSSKLQVAAGSGLIDDQDWVGTFDPNDTAPSTSMARPAQLVTGAKPNPVTKQTGSASNLVGSHSSHSWMTESLFARISQMLENTLAKVDQLDNLTT
jgi:hypothetical protein